MKTLTPDFYHTTCSDGRKWLLKHFPKGISLPLSKKDYNKIYKKWTAWGIGVFIYRIYDNRLWFKIPWTNKTKVLKAASECLQKGKVTKKILLKYKLWN